VTSTAEFLAAVCVALDNLQIKTMKLERYTTELRSTMSSVEEGRQDGSQLEPAGRVDPHR
jgi:hypothetical protein